ncbi:hypothetical protein BGZ73_000142 [Actinomortierella ambigua]|nr:hypothetical protein BGZ73_000142 [Actinomortierella ambigua]
MGSDWYDFVCVTAVGIPVPKELLLQPFDLQGFKLLIAKNTFIDDKVKTLYDVCSGAMICLAETELDLRVIEVMGPYNIENHKGQCKRMKHLDSFLPADTGARLIQAYETYTGRKPDVEPGFWTVSATTSSALELLATWSPENRDVIADEDELYFNFVVLSDYEDSDQGSPN